MCKYCDFTLDGQAPNGDEFFSGKNFAADTCNNSSVIVKKTQHSETEEDKNYFWFFNETADFHSTPIYYCTVDIKFCPFCGRELK